VHSADHGGGLDPAQTMRRFEFIVNTAEEFMTLVNRDYVYEAVNRSYCRARNCSDGDIIGRSVRDIWGEERFTEVLKRHFDECFSGKEVRHEEWFDFPLGGRGYFDVRYYPYRAGAAEVTHAVVVTHDITRRKLAEESLRHSEEKFSKAFHLSPESVAIATVREGRYVDVNEAFLRLTGYARDEVIGLTSRELDLWVDRSDCAQVMEILSQGGLVTDREVKFRNRSGQIRTVLFSAESIQHEGDLCMISVARDISERKHAEEGLHEEVRSLGAHLLSDRLEHEDAFADIITRNRKMRSVFRYVEAVAASPQPVFITGETGVGKELVARVLHDLSGRKGPFVAVNVAGLDDTVFSDTLFGHRKGAFTGAEQPREGLLAQASGGTLFLDEIGDLRESSQVTLLRLLQDHTYYPLGSDTPRRSDARVLVATNHRVENRIAEGRFRRDLYYRLRTHHVHIPPLSERKEDIPLLLERFVAEAAQALNRKRPSLSPELVPFLSSYDFPGNVRELHAMVFDAVACHRKGRLGVQDFKDSLDVGGAAPASPAPVGPVGEAEHFYSLFGRFPTLREAELLLISEAMRQSGNNQGAAATLLGMTRQALNKRLHRTPELSAARKT